MAFYRKKRRKVGPSKNEKKVGRAQIAEDNERAAGTISSRYPHVKALRVKVSIATPQGVVLETSEETYGPNDPLVLEADCPGSCGSGAYDFAALIAEPLERRDERGAAQVICVEPSYSGAAGAQCGCIAKVEFTAEVAKS
ncbi:MAG: hypothetical protein M0D55_08140 [Elusimicrobiota bacterium]|nr:MAG: hypothetical protein M0D55_08140 [Elusimicrobiota bacterium]